MIKPVNNHLIIEPVPYESFMASGTETYDEVGVVIAVPDLFEDMISEAPKVGQKVFFDSWLASKYPSPNKDSFYWLVRFDDVRAIDVGE